MSYHIDVPTSDNSDSSSDRNIIIIALGGVCAVVMVIIVIFIMICCKKKLCNKEHIYENVVLSNPAPGQSRGDVRATATTSVDNHEHQALQSSDAQNIPISVYPQTDTATTTVAGCVMENTQANTTSDGEHTIGTSTASDAAPNADERGGTRKYASIRAPPSDEPDNAATTVSDHEEEEYATSMNPPLNDESPTVDRSLTMEVSSSPQWVNPNRSDEDDLSSQQQNL